MPEKNITQRLLIIGAVIVFAACLLRNPSQTLRPGLDIAGGTSLIFEIDTSGAEEQRDLAERVKQLLQKRVDPQGVYDLVWRVQGRNRIEVQMPLPPKDAKERLEHYREALDDLYQHEINRGALERALRMGPGADRDAALHELALRNSAQALEQIDTTDAEKADQERRLIEDGVQQREELMRTAAGRHDQLLAARQALKQAQAEQSETIPVEDETADTQPAATTQPDLEALELELRDGRELFEDAVYEVLRTNLNRRRFQEVIELDQKSDLRKQSIDVLKQQHTDLLPEIDRALAAHSEWRRGRQFLDGPGDLKRLLRGAGRLEFRILAEPSPDNVTKFDRYRKELTEKGREWLEGGVAWLKVDNPMQFFDLDSPSDLDALRENYKTHGLFVIETLGNDWYVLGKTTPSDGLLQGQGAWKLTSAQPDYDQQGRWCVRFRLNAVGGHMFEQLTRANIGKQLAILVDDVAYSAPRINSAIRTQGEITGEFSQEKVNYLVRTMEGGTLPARLKDTPLSERTVGSSLGETNRDHAVTAGIIGAIAVAVVMVGYYLIVCGFIADFALMLNIFLILSAMAMLNARITLVGIAGIILSVGMAVDANVLIFERMREEKERGTSLRMIVKNGYDKALSTILDSNITTLLTCIIIYYVGSEEVKGFGLTLGWGIVLNLFTSIFVTRTLFGVLLKYHVIKDIKMLRIIGVPKIDWYAKRKFFLPLSAAIMLIGLGLLVDRGKRNVFDVEFLGGVAAEFELKQAGLDDRDIQHRLSEVSNEISEVAEHLDQAEVAPVPDQLNTFAVTVTDVTPERLAALITEPLEEAKDAKKNPLVEHGGVSADPGTGCVQVIVRDGVTRDQLVDLVHGLGSSLQAEGDNLSRANVNAVLEVGGVAQQGTVWNITTTVTNMHLVEHALTSALGNEMQVQPSISYVFHGEGEQPYPITDRLLEAVVPGVGATASYDLTNFLGGAAMYFTDVNPPQSAQEIRLRLDNMHFQPDFQDMPKRNFDVVGVDQVEGDVDDGGNPLYRSLVVVSVDPDYRFGEDPEQWYVGFAQGELKLVKTAFESEQTLRKVMQFKPQIASRSTQQASIALLLSWAMIIGYMWIRFGRPMYGVAGVAALIHDALIALAFVGISGWLGGV